MSERPMPGSRESRVMEAFLAREERLTRGMAQFMGAGPNVGAISTDEELALYNARATEADQQTLLRAGVPPETVTELVGQFGDAVPIDEGALFALGLPRHVVARLVYANRYNMVEQSGRKDTADQVRWAEDMRRKNREANDATV